MEINHPERSNDAFEKERRSLAAERGVLLSEPEFTARVQDPNLPHSVQDVLNGRTAGQGRMPVDSTSGNHLPRQYSFAVDGKLFAVWVEDFRKAKD